MNKLTKKVLAAIAASVMAVTAVSPSVYANVSYDTVLDGWVKTGDTQRRYENGVPYTGWLNVEDGTKKYCLNGYLVKGNFTIGRKTYSFGKEDGVLKGDGTEAAFSAECGEVNPDTAKIELHVYANKNEGKEYSVGNPEKMERWVKGKWTDCKAKNTDYTVDDSASLFSCQRSNTVYFYPRRYTGSNLSEGYYRITLSARDESDAKASAKKFYAIFKVTPKNIYRDGLLDEGTLTRRYSKETPYTGWSQVRNGLKKYYLDGYAMTGELQMDDVIYTFDGDGNLVSSINAGVSADCGKKVSEGSNINVSVYSTVNKNEKYYAVTPVHITHWEYGRWSECSTDYLTSGYYKADLTARSVEYDTIRNVSNIFEVVPYEVVKNGWVKENGTERRYKSGRPYTGWTESSDGSRKYCYDGYVVTGDFQIGKYIYSFRADGIYTGIRRKLTVTADCGNAIASASDSIKITVVNSGADGKNYTLGLPYKMERWENGKWVSCMGNGVYYAVPAISLTVYAKSDRVRSNSEVMAFDPQAYTGYNFTPGYYRIALNGWPSDLSSAARQDIYAMFEVV
ncbi:MAG: hypothetical protein J1F11_03500 [Oscillospiraceae bacterium]|nr:hypothetical protein [Oscillospiraceae bacterium]